DSTFNSLGVIPYTFKRSESDLAENVFTYGYPQDQPMYDDGRITSQYGLNGDSVDYQFSIPVNPGNSGGPLFDSKGNVIGIVKARQTQMEGAHFASKTSYLLAAIDSLSADSLTKRPVVLNAKNTLTGLSRQLQIKKLQNYVFLVKVYAKN
ncbi:MAG: S1 family peptidase, partial [Mucilaginibacter sp.]